MTMRVAGLFSGIGGIEEGLEEAGHDTVLMCEIDKRARKVLEARFPDVEKHDDVATLPDLPSGIGLLSAGFPCQDLSRAGRTRGIDGPRSGLVRHVFRLAAKARVPWILLENVPFMLRLDRGRAMAVIVDALEELGYRWAYRVVDTRSFGLPHRRERVFLLASKDDDPRSVLFADDAGCLAEHGPCPVAYGFYVEGTVFGVGFTPNAVPPLKLRSPPAIWMPDGRIVWLTIEDAERVQGFMRGWTAPAGKPSPRRRLLGNAVSVPVAEWIGRRLMDPGVVASADDKPLSQLRSWPTAAYNVGYGRFATSLSPWPKREKGLMLHELVDPTSPLLSRRATAGFLSRCYRDPSRIPGELVQALEGHLRRMEALTGPEG